MAIKVKAVERLLKFNKDDAGEYRYVMQPELYISLKEQKVIREAALRTRHGLPKGTLWHCPVWARCASASRHRLWPTSTM